MYRDKNRNSTLNSMELCAFESFSMKFMTAQYLLNPLRCLLDTCYKYKSLSGDMQR